MHNVIDATQLIEQIREEVANNHIQLPTLPEVALEVRDAVEKDQADASKIAKIVTQDAALSARLIQVANSPLYRGRASIDNVQLAITRMGLKLVRSLVVSLAMKQMFQAASNELNVAFRRIWTESVEVAAMARVLARQVEGLEPEQAMLAGLIHNIGTLPILTKLDELLGLEAKSQIVDQICRDLSPELGRHILTEWHFSESLSQIPVECTELARNSGQIDYSDVVLVARLQYLVASGQQDETTAISRWNEYPAFTKIGIGTESTIMDMEGPAEEVAEVRDMLCA